MSANGARPALLLRELFSGDGPYASIAEDFVASICSACGGRVDREGAEHHDAGYLCSSCRTRLIGTAR
ncbi:MAG: hypothetical protein R3290_03230 [Acidimicrobiia bacterium]|nr:hypothetical protein [Acidimicrobiia bacterium]